MLEIDLCSGLDVPLCLVACSGLLSNKFVLLSLFSSMLMCARREKKNKQTEKEREKERKEEVQQKMSKEGRKE